VFPIDLERLSVSIQKWRITVQAKAAAISQPQAVCGTVEDGKERERRHGL